MSETLLQTKLFIPALRPNLVHRSRLTKRLNQGLQQGCKLTLVTAPAGYGKTTLVSSWIQHQAQSATWLSLDEGDNSPYRFIFYMIAALQTIDQALGETVTSLLQAPQPPPPDTLLTLLINDLAALPKQVFLVLDDYHVIQNLEIHQALTFLLDHQPPQLHLIMVSREDPALPLHRLRGSGQMTGIYVRDLRFTAEEVAQFINETMGIKLDPEELAVLERRTEGWVAGLQLAALSMQDTQDPREFLADFAGDDRYISDYLINEVFERQPAQVQDFLLKTAILDRFSVPLCEAILGTGERGLGIGDPGQLQSSRTIIERLDQSNLFIISLDNKREWYRYHHLFTDFLRLRLREQPADEIVDLHRRAAAWYAQRDFTEEAIEHYLTVKDFAQAADMIESVGVQLIVQGKLRKLLDWLAVLPDDLVSKRPLLCVCHAWALNITGQASASEPLLHEAEQAVATNETVEARHIRGLIDMLRAYRARREGDLIRSTQLLSQATANLSSNDLLVRSTVNLNLGFNYLLMGQLARAVQVLQVARKEGQAAEAVYITLIAMAVQANSYVAQGKLCQAIELYEEAIAYGLARNRGRPFPPAGYAYAGLGQVMYERNKVDIAEQLLKQAVQLGESIADWSIVRRGLLPLAWLKQMAGDPATAQTLWQQALTVVHRAESERVESKLEAQWARLQLKQATSDSSALAAAVEWAGTYRDRQPDASSYHEALAQMTLAQVELAQGQIDQAILRLKQLAETAAASGQIDNLIKIKTLQALAYDAKGDVATALEKLDDALALAAPEGYIRTFADHGLPAQRLFQKASVRSPTSDYSTRILSAFPAVTQGEIPSAQPVNLLDNGLLVETLTERELSMLRLMATGLSNREIADELFLSVNTVKVYASRIYSKLGVHSRAEAIFRAQNLGLV